MNPVPLIVIGGYLGAGKTTLLNQLLRDPSCGRVAVLVNDFGSVNIDADLIESRSDEVIRLTGGCVCCRYGADLVGTLRELITGDSAYECILMEASGVGLPGAIARSAALAQGVACRAVIVVADASRIPAQLVDAYVGDTVRQQLADADVILLNKCDLTATEQLEGTARRLALQFPVAQIFRTIEGVVPAELVLDAAAGAMRPLPCETDRIGAVPSGSRAHGYVTECFAVDRPLDVMALASALAALDPPLARAKAILRHTDGSLRVLQVGDGTFSAHQYRGAAGPTPLVCIAVTQRYRRESIEQALVAAAASG